MKKLALTLITLTLITLITSCKSTGGHCDAYGNKSGSVDNMEFDIHSSHQSNLSKYTTTTSIK